MSVVKNPKFKIPAVKITTVKIPSTQYYPQSYGKRNVEIESSVQVIFDFCNDNGDLGLTWNEVEDCEVSFSN